MQKITSATSQLLYNSATTRRIEQQATGSLPPHTLMQRAGLSIARLTMALAPHARRIWIACGPGNNGGDGFEAALHLHRWGKAVVVTWTGLPPGQATPSPDACISQEKAIAAGVPIAQVPPQDFDFCIDALLGLGAKPDASRPDTLHIWHWLNLMHASQAPRLAVDVVTGLDADTGQSTFGMPAASKPALKPASKTVASCKPVHDTEKLFTLSLLTLKTGLFTAEGRDCSGEVWFDDLGVDTLVSEAPDAWLLGADRAAPPPRTRAAHASHKGVFGDVAILGGESTPTSHMAGAALLAARAALHAGAGRVFVALLDGASDSSHARLTVDPLQPELMFRSPAALNFKHQVLVCGCGGGEAVKTILAKVLATAPRLVLDADALNAIAGDVAFEKKLIARDARNFATVLTPHPLEAARLLGNMAAEVQADRLMSARQLAEKFRCVVVLKGSGTVIAAPGQTSRINSSGNPLLATAGTGDVLAGMIGAYLASGLGAFDAACGAVFAHGHLADLWAHAQPARVLTAAALANFQRWAPGRPTAG